MVPTDRIAELFIIRVILVLFTWPYIHVPYVDNIYNWWMQCTNATLLE